jgi:hypothetical protein
MAKQAMPDLRNATDAFLVDEAARLRAEKARIELLEKYFSTALDARLKGRDGVQGEKFIMRRESVTQERISPEKCRELLDAETLSKVTVTTSFYQKRFSPKPAESFIIA